MAERNIKRQRAISRYTKSTKNGRRNTNSRSMAFKLLLKATVLVALHGANPTDNDFVSASVAIQNSARGHPGVSNEKEGSAHPQLRRVLRGSSSVDDQSKSVPEEQNERNLQSPTEAPTETFGPTSLLTIETFGPTSLPAKETFGPTTTFFPTGAGSSSTTAPPTKKLTIAPTRQGDTLKPTASPTKKLTIAPTRKGDTLKPTASPTKKLTIAPTRQGDTLKPTASPTKKLTIAPTRKGDTLAPTGSPTNSPNIVSKDTGCTDDPEYRNNNEPKRDCSTWASVKPEMRCAFNANEVFRACPATCDPACSATNNPVPTDFPVPEDDLPFFGDPAPTDSPVPDNPAPTAPVPTAALVSNNPLLNDSPVGFMLTNPLNSDGDVNPLNNGGDVEAQLDYLSSNMRRSSYFSSF
jgi:uncharacterized Zn-binding protein involved in type VI secretion